MRLDKFIFDNFNLKSRTYAENLILKGKVLVNGKSVLKPSFEVTEKDDISIDENCEYESLGGDKLAKALKEFDISLKDKTCVDIGASNGGFTDCMLQNGAKKIYAVDVAKCAFSNRLSENKSIIIRDNLNARNILPENVDGLHDFITIDVSFISVKLVLKNCLDLLKIDGESIVLIKPQFEYGKLKGKSGIINDCRIRGNIVKDVILFANNLGFKCINLTATPKNFERKNVEYLARFVNKNSTKFAKIKAFEVDAFIF